MGNTPLKKKRASSGTGGGKAGGGDHGGGKPGALERSGSKVLDGDKTIFVEMVQELWEEGNKLFQHRDYEHALLNYEKAVRLLPTSAALDASNSTTTSPLLHADEPTRSRNYIVLHYSEFHPEIKVSESSSATTVDAVSMMAGKVRGHGSYFSALPG